MDVLLEQPQHTHIIWPQFDHDIDQIFWAKLDPIHLPLNNIIFPLFCVKFPW